MLIGYMRVSSNDERQSVSLQRDALIAAGVDPRHLHQDHASGARDNRPGLKSCLAELREGDVLIVWKLDRLGRSLSHLLRIIEDLKIRGIAFRSLTGSIDTTTPHGSFLFNLFGTLAEYERTLITERVNAGLAAALRRGRSALEQLLTERVGEKSILGWITEAPEGVKLKNLKGLIARLEVLRTAAISDSNVNGFM